MGWEDAMVGNWDEATKLNAYETAMEFYLKEMETHPGLRKQYKIIAYEIINMQPQHPRRDEFLKRLAKT